MTTTDRSHLWLALVLVIVGSFLTMRLGILNTSIGKVANPVTISVATTEDSVGWDCELQGNGICGSGEHRSHLLYNYVEVGTDRFYCLMYGAESSDYCE